MKKSTTRVKCGKKRSYSANVIKRFRRTKAQVKNLLEWAQHVLDGEEGQVTCRHLFYRLVGASVIEKTEAQYQLLIKQLGKWRRSGVIAWNAFADSTRYHIKAPSFDSMAQALEETATVYRRNLWASQNCYIELICEKDAMAGILGRAADPFGVPIFVVRGFASLTSLHSAAETYKGWARIGKRCVIYHFGDHDPSGVAAGLSIQKALKEFGAEVEFVRAAVTAEQIQKFKLPTRPTKSSSHSKNWKGGDSVELDAMEPAAIRSLVESCIGQHIDQHAWAQTQKTEQLERETLEYLQRYGPGFHETRMEMRAEEEAKKAELAQRLKGAA